MLPTTINKTIDSRDIATMIEKMHKNLVRDIENYIHAISESSNLSSQDFFIESSYKVLGNNKSYKKYDCTKMGCEFIANKLTGKKGIQFTAMYVSKFNMMEQGTPITQESPQVVEFKRETHLLTVAMEVLRLPETGKIKLLDRFAKKHNMYLPLPGYAINEEITESATALLEKNNVGISAKAFNMILLENGILQEVVRLSSRGKKKTYKSLTSEGVKYGKNLINPTNEKETQPHYYPNKFRELLKLVGISLCMNI